MLACTVRVRLLLLLLPLQIRAVHGYGTGNGWTLNRGVAIYSTDFNNINTWGA